MRYLPPLVSAISVSQVAGPSREQRAGTEFQKLKLEFKTKIWKTTYIRVFLHPKLDKVSIGWVREEEIKARKKLRELRH